MFLQQLINGVTIGSMYALVAIGYSMIFSVLQLINFSNGSMYMLGAYVALMLYLRLEGHFLLAFAGSLVIVGVIGYGVDRFALRPLRKKKSNRMASLMSTFGVGIVIDNAIQLLFGSETKSFPNQLDFGSFSVGNAIVSWTQVLILLICSVLMAALSLVVYRTKAGRAMRSTAENVDAARLMGVGSLRIIFIHILPNIWPTLLSGLTIGFNNAVLAEASMSYLGIGVNTAEPSLGYLLKDGQGVLFTLPWCAVFPGLAAILLILGVSLLGEGIRERMGGTAL